MNIREKSIMPIIGNTYTFDYKDYVLTELGLKLSDMDYITWRYDISILKIFKASTEEIALLINSDSFMQMEKVKKLFDALGINSYLVRYQNIKHKVMIAKVNSFLQDDSIQLEGVELRELLLSYQDNLIK